jgi:hypothetical protein
MATHEYEMENSHITRVGDHRFLGPWMVFQLQLVELGTSYQ